MRFLKGLWARFFPEHDVDILVGIRGTGHKRPRAARSCRAGANPTDRTPLDHCGAGGRIVSVVPVRASVTATAILVRDLGNYHVARFEAFNRRDTSAVVLAMIGSSQIPQFSAGANAVRKLTVSTLASDQGGYARMLQRRELQSAVVSRLEAMSPDVIVISGWAQPESFLGLLWARRNGAGVVLMSESQECDAPRSALREAIKRRFVSACDSAIVGGRSHAAYLEKLGMNPGKVSLGYDVVDNRYFEEGSHLAHKDDRAPT